MSKSADSSQVEKKSYPTQETTASISQQLQTGDDHVQNKITPSKSATNVEQDKDEWGNFNGLEDKKVRSTFIRKFLVINTQLIMGGKRHEINPEDHVYASLMLYIDIAHIFMYVLAVWY
ncbi:unnamed protein product [Rotaria magnacalcarata]|uniref:Uncharacterized protein n=1 Tax=Rotaria magnacalcarata TaxID=392030 RepID=A0A816M2J1_9BILA|nr:unnamed protein product [Rotaria magnacalcarata]CAF2033957.1 unnamed protein product [Rotaria magnacalcarata]